MARTLFLCHSVTASVSVTTDLTQSLYKIPTVNTATYSMSLTLGPVTPPTNSTQFGYTNQSSRVTWISKPILRQVIMTTTDFLVVNYRARETATGANATITALAYKFQESGTYASTVITLPTGLSELTTSMANYNRTASFNGTYTFEPLTRLALQLFIDDASGVTLSGTRQVLLEIGHLTAHTSLTVSKDIVFIDDVVAKTHTTDSYLVNSRTKTHTTDSYLYRLFPTTGIKDSFNRANVGPPPSSNWTCPYNGIKVLSNQCAATTAADTNLGFWAANTFGTGNNIETYLTVAVKPSDTEYVELWLTDDVNFNGYLVRVTAVAGAGNDTFQVYKAVAGNVGAAVGAALTQELTAGDSIGLSVIGSTISVYYKPSAGSWTLLGTRTDSTYSSIDAITIALFGTTVRVDDFGGGTYGTVVNTKTFTTDSFLALGVVTSTKTFSTDSALWKQQTKTYITDSLKRATQTKTYSSDSLIKAVQTKVFTTDSLLYQIGQITKTFSTDSLLLKTQTVNFLTDTYLKNLNTKTFSTDSNLLKQQIAVFSTSSYLKAFNYLDPWTRTSDNVSTSWADGVNNTSTWANLPTKNQTWTQKTTGNQTWTNKPTKNATWSKI